MDPTKQGVGQSVSLFSEWHGEKHEPSNRRSCGEWGVESTVEQQRQGERLLFSFLSLITRVHSFDPGTVNGCAAQNTPWGLVLFPTASINIVSPIIQLGADERRL
jgi:hypothetical protein